jgi:Subtilase family
MKRIINERKIYIMYTVATINAKYDNIFQLFLKRLFLGVALLLVMGIITPSVGGQGEGEEQAGDMQACILGESLLRSQGDTLTFVGAGEIDTGILNDWGEVEEGFLIAPIVTFSGMSPDEIVANSNEVFNVLLLVIDDFSKLLGDNTQLTHGGYVAEVTMNTWMDFPDDGLITIETVNYGVDSDPTLTTVLQRTVERINQLGGADQYDVIVLNMSWVILRCSGTIMDNVNVNVFAFNAYLQDNLDGYDFNNDGMTSFIEFIIGDNDELDFEQDNDAVREALAVYVLSSSYNLETELGQNTFNYLAEILNISPGELAGIFQSNSDIYNEANVFTNWVNDLCSECQVIPIAAAGNFSPVNGAPLPPFAPAAWLNVLAVSGSLARDPGEMWTSSHYGQLMAAAAVHQFSTNEQGAGTSFAAPMVSVLVSFMAAHTTCDIQSIMSINKAANGEFVSEILSRCQ